MVEQHELLAGKATADAGSDGPQEGFTLRFLRLLDAHVDPDLGPKERAASLGVSPRALYTWQDGSRRPDYRTIRKVVAALGLDPDAETDKILGDDPVRPRGAPRWRKAVEAKGGPASVAPVAAQPGLPGAVFALNSAPVSVRLVNPTLPPDARGADIGCAPMLLRHEWLYMLGDPATMRAFTARGGTMEPLVRDGDLVLVDAGQVQPVDGQLYVLRRDGGPVVRRLFVSQRALSAWRLSQNQADIAPVAGQHSPDSQEEVVMLPAGDGAQERETCTIQNVDIVGRLVWVGRDLTRA